MTTTKTEYDVDLCIIGAGSAGLSMAAGAAMLDRNVLLFEGAEMGGDCLNHGCVPSKAILKAGKIAQAHRSGEGFGIKPQDPIVDWGAVKAHISGVIATIAPHDSVERFEGLGATVITEYAKFVDENTVESDTTRVRAKRFVISVGSRASAPPIPGLDTIDYATNENIFSLETFPAVRRLFKGLTWSLQALSMINAASMLMIILERPIRRFTLLAMSPKAWAD